MDKYVNVKGQIGMTATIRTILYSIEDSVELSPYIDER